MQLLRNRRDAPPEAELLLCVGRRADAETAARAERLLTEEIDWPRLLDLARRHGVEPLLHQLLQRLPAGAAPSELVEPLRRRYREISVQNLFLAGELLRIVERFRGEGISLIPCKGPLLAIAAYGDLSLRRFLDLDLLAPPEDFGRARRLLGELGYRRSLAAPHEDAFLQSFGQLPLVRDDGRSLVELHANLGMRGFPYRASFAELWDRRETVPLAGREIGTLRAEDLLLYLCVHGAKHQWERLSWICDIAAVLRSRPDLDWDHVQREAARLHCRRMLELGLCLPRVLFDVETPGAMHSTPIVRTMAAKIERGLFRDGPPGAVESAAFHFHARERWRDRLHCATSLLLNPTPADWEQSRLPSRWRRLHAALRPFRLLRKHLKTS
jgi:hypothetical protein